MPKFILKALNNALSVRPEVSKGKRHFANKSSFMLPFMLLYISTNGVRRALRMMVVTLLASLRLRQCVRTTGLSNEAHPLNCPVRARRRHRHRRAPARAEALRGFRADRHRRQPRGRRRHDGYRDRSARHTRRLHSHHHVRQLCHECGNVQTSLRSGERYPAYGFTWRYGVHSRAASVSADKKRRANSSRSPRPNPARSTTAHRAMAASPTSWRIVRPAGGHPHDAHRLQRHRPRAERSPGRPDPAHFGSAPSTIPLVRANRLRAIAVTTAKRRPRSPICRPSPKPCRVTKSNCGYGVLGPGPAEKYHRPLEHRNPPGDQAAGLERAAHIRRIRHRR